MRRIATVVALVTVGLRPISAQHRTADSIKSTLEQWAASRRVVGIAVAWIDSGRVERVVAGSTRTSGGVPVDETTSFEIGSITKAFTGLLLADMVLKGEVALDDPAAKYLHGWTLPRFNGRDITLLDLATQSSGLPRMPDNIEPVDANDPYADYSDARLRSFLGHYQLTRAPGAQYEYSNLGVGLLGRILAIKAGRSYSSLLRTRILDPLGMSSTSLTVDSASMHSVALGYGNNFAAVEAWHFDALQAAGALHSNLHDLLKLAAALRDTTTGPLAKVVAFAMRPRRPISGADSIGLAWHHMHVGGADVVWHNGGTAGFRSWLSADPHSGRAVVVLANAGSIPADAIGVSLQRGTPLTPPPVGQQQEVSLPSGSLSRLVGRYQLAPQFVIEISARGDTLWAQATNQPQYPVFPSSATIFFYKVVPAELVFQLDGEQHVTGLVLRQNGAEMPGKRLP